MPAKGKNKISKWGLKGNGLRKHARSGYPANHALGIARTRERNKELEKEVELRKKRKGEMFGSVKEVFNS